MVAAVQPHPDLPESLRALLETVRSRRHQADAPPGLTGAPTHYPRIIQPCITRPQHPFTYHNAMKQLLSLIRAVRGVR